MAYAREALRDGTGRRLREEARISLREAATVLLVSPASLSLWERGQAAPKGRRAVAYAEWLGTLLELAE